MFTMSPLLMVVVCVFGLGAAALDGDDKAEKPKITLFSESYCPDCIKFMEEQMVPAFNNFSSNILFDLVPFGNAEKWYENGHWRFRCQHGKKECIGNKLQACAIFVACGEHGSVNCPTLYLRHVLLYIGCTEASDDQEKASEKCARSSALSPTKIRECANGRQGEQLLNLYGNRTEAFTPAIQYVPTVAINDVHNEAAERDLYSEICKLRPDLCKPTKVVYLIK